MRSAMISSPSLKDVYGEEQVLPRSNEEMKELALNLVRGVPIATPVFDGADEADIRRNAEKSRSEESGQVTLFDGRTGERSRVR